jgi:hypothetical protein
MRSEFEKTIIPQPRRGRVPAFQERASERQIITVESHMMGRGRGSLPRWRVALFQFLSRAEKRKRVVAANMNGHFIDGFARSSDIGRAEIALPKVTRMRMAQTPATGDARKRMARRCFSAATGACR